MLGGAASPGGDDLLTVTVVRDEYGYGMKVSGDNPVYVQSVKEHGAAWRAGLRAGDRILRVDSVAVHNHTHQQVVHMIRANPTTVLTVQQNTSRHKKPITVTAPFPVNLEKQRQLEASKIETVQRMLRQEQDYIRQLRSELSKVPDVRKQTQLEMAEKRCVTLQHEIDIIRAGQLTELSPPAPHTPRLAPRRPNTDKTSPQNSFLSALPRSLSNLTGQSLRNLRQKQRQENQPPLVRQNSDESNNKRRHNNTVPIVPTTCLDNVTPPPLPPRSIERPPKRNPLSPTMSPINPLAKPSSSQKNYYKKPFPMHQSMPPYDDNKFSRSSHSLDGDLEGPQPNSIALQMNYPLVNQPPPPLQTDNRTGVPVLHVRSRSSPEQLDHELPRPPSGVPSGVPSPPVGVPGCEKEAWERGTPPPGTPPPPYAHNTQPCADPQRAIISMEEDDSPASDNSTYSGLFSNLRCVRESKARTAVLLNWLLGERRSATAGLVLVLTDGYRSASGVTNATLRRWAYEIHSTFLMPNAVLQLSGVDENMANEIEHVLVNEYDKDELLRNVFRKARQKAKEELSRQLSEFQVKRQVGLGSLYGPEDSVLERCDVDKAQEVVVVERLLCPRLSSVAAGGACGGLSGDAHSALLQALYAAAICLQCRAASVASAVGNSRASFLQRDKLYKQKVKQLAKQHPQPFIVRGHHLQLQALTSVGHCHHCDNAIWGLAPQAYVCTYCKLRVHRACAKQVEEGCCLDGEHHNNRISRFMERIHSNQPNNQDSGDKKSRKASTNSHFLNMERSFRKMEDEPFWDQTLTPTSVPGESRREGSTEEQTAPDADVDTSDANTKDTPDKDNKLGSNWRTATPSGRGVNRAESCRERDAPRRGKHRNASDPNRLTAHNNHDLEPCAGAPSGSSSGSSLSSRSNESNTVQADQHASQSDWSEEDEPLAAQWADSLPPHVLDSILSLSHTQRKRQEVIHELIVSEGSHVRWLKVLGGVFLRPLESHPALLPPEELRALFPNLPGVRERHARLYADLKTIRTEAPSHIVPIRPLADALLNTLGESGYSACLARFCRGQRMALDSLRERRRKNKELHQFLAAREQLPLCGRLQLRDLLACVWQRLTKYQLLLESVIKTVDESEGDSAEDIARLRRALDTAKDVLHSVDTAIRTAENEHRLRTIVNKLEVRVPSSGPEWDEVRRLDLSQHTLRYEGELSLRNDSNKKCSVLALMLEDCLVLLHREGDKFILKPIPQPSQPGLLSPLIKWDKVLFRPNAAVRNTFFLMNINGVQMHELSSTPSEYANWVKHIQDAPLAKLAEAKPNITPSHQPSRSTDDSGINVSRNPSDASEKSEKSEKSIPNSDDIPSESERDRASLERSSTERDDKRVEKEDKEAEVADREEKHTPRRPTVGRISTHSSPPPTLHTREALTVVSPAAHTASTALTQHERLRRLDEGISKMLRAKSAVVADILGVPPDCYAQVSELAVADTLGQVDVLGELRLRGTREEAGAPDLHQLLLAAHAQTSHLLEGLSKMMNVSETAAVTARTRRGRCDRCCRLVRSSTVRSQDESTEPLLDKSLPDELTDEPSRPEAVASAVDLLTDTSFDMLSDLDAGVDVDDDGDDGFDTNLSSAEMAARLSTMASGLTGTLSRLLAAYPALEASRRALRNELSAVRDANDALRARYRTEHQTTDETAIPKAGPDPSIQDQPSNGG